MNEVVVGAVFDLQHPAPSRFMKRAKRAAGEGGFVLGANFAHSSLRPRRSSILAARGIPRLGINSWTPCHLNKGSQEEDHKLKEMLTWITKK